MGNTGRHIARQVYSQRYAFLFPARPNLSATFVALSLKHHSTTHPHNPFPHKYPNFVILACRTTAYRNEWDVLWLYFLFCSPKIKLKICPKLWLLCSRCLHDIVFFGLKKVRGLEKINSG